jgi:hypothetical protein
MHKKHEPIIWDNNKGELTDFYQVAKGLELNHIIYVSDSLGILNSVWATSEEDIVDCFYSFSDNYLFGRIQKIEDVLDDSFFDEFKTSNQNELLIQDRTFIYDSQQEAFEGLTSSLTEDFIWDSYDEIDFWMKEFIRDQGKDEEWVNSAINEIGNGYYMIKAWFNSQTEREELWSETSFDLIKMFANSFD